MEALSTQASDLSGSETERWVPIWIWVRRSRRHVLAQFSLSSAQFVVWAGRFQADQTLPPRSRTPGGPAKNYLLVSTQYPYEKEYMQLATELEPTRIDERQGQGRGTGGSRESSSILVTLVSYIATHTLSGKRACIPMYYFPIEQHASPCLGLGCPGRGRRA